MYKRRSKLTIKQQEELIKLFVVGATARASSELVGVHRNTAATYIYEVTPSYSRAFAKLSRREKLKRMRAILEE